MKMRCLKSKDKVMELINIDLQWFAVGDTVDFDEEEGDSSEVIFWENKFNYAEFFSGKI